ncbi:MULTISPECIES: TetR/AcrR family transcriptional regulator [Pseudoalteromonas]|uniref:TetR/AcrR family transcriptional regulator n=1 Tax=Pseudoalteromonas undina TaxID=43660 RepID=A0ACC6R4K1_9GAMM|nr:TetR/AcrR family transcriptional regulator [Pseudoalteromonas sp. P1-25]KPZ56801.1 Bacterial regulatory protein, tetR family [Pseudoalteromonas sp. P1-25]
MPAPKYTIAKQEELIVDAAVECVLESSLLDFKMSNIAKSAGISMGSVYKHVQSKEDVLVALSVRIDSQALKVIQEVLALPYTLPVKIIAIHLLSQEAMYRYPFGYQLINMMSAEDLLAKASVNWVTKLAHKAQEIRGLFQNSLNEAVQKEELLCSAEEKDELIEEIMFLHWALNIAFPQILSQPYDTNKSSNRSVRSEPIALNHPIIRTAIRTTNSYPWKNPVSIKDLIAIEKLLIERGLR